MSHDLSGLRSELDARVRFETMLVELSMRFINIPACEVDGAISEAQRRVCASIGVDMSTLWQCSEENPADYTLTHLYRPLGGPPVPERMSAMEFFPWSLGLLAAGEHVLAPSLDDLPPEAARDRDVLRQLGIISSLGLPLAVGGAPPVGVITFHTTQAEHDWPGDLIRRLNLVAQIFANALARKRSDQALREGEERLALAAESAGMGLWSVDLGSRRAWVTPKALELLGLPEDEPVTLDRLLGLIHRDDRDSVLKTIEEVVESRQEGRCEYRVVRPDGGVRWIASRGRVRCDPSGEPDRLTGVSIDITERKRAEDELRDLSQRLIRAHEEERALLARELHDDLTQRLAVLAIDVGRAELAAPGGAQAETMRAVREGLSRLSEDIHSLAYQLHPSILEELGLAEALRTECERIGRQGRVELSAELDPLPAVVGRDAALCLFRVAQESLNNVIRHAGARAAKLVLRQGDGGLLLAVRDDGVGFDPGSPRQGRSLGLASMRERLRLVNGTLDIESAPGRGTAIVAWVPVEGGSR